MIANFTIITPKIAVLDANQGTGTAQSSSTASTIVLAASTSQADGYYANKSVRIVSGKGAGQVRQGTAYVGATDTLTVSPAWKTIPDATSVYEIFVNANGDFYDVDGPVVTVKDGWKVTLENVGPIHPGWIRLVGGENFRPSITLRNCVLRGTEGDDDDILGDPSVVIDKSGSSTDAEVRFEGCRYGGAGARHFCRDGLWRKGAANTGGGDDWVWWRDQ